MKTDLVKLKRSIDVRKERTDFWENFNKWEDYTLGGKNDIFCFMKFTVEVKIRIKDIKGFKKPLPTRMCKIQTIYWAYYFKGRYKDNENVTEFLPGHVTVSFANSTHSLGVDMINEYFELVDE